MVALVEDVLSVLGKFSVVGVVIGVDGCCAASGVICAERARAAMSSAEGKRRLRNGILVTLRQLRESQ